MKQQLAAVFSAAKSPTYMCKTRAGAQLGPLLKCVTDIERQVAEHRERLFATESAEGGHQMTGALERLHQTLEALEKDKRDVANAVRRLQLGFAQYERYAADIEQQLSIQQ